MLTDPDEALTMLESLVVFRNVPVLTALRDVLAERGSKAARVRRYADFAALLYAEGGNLTDSVLEGLAEDGNDYVLRRARGEDIPPLLERRVREELAMLQEVSQLPAEFLWRYTGFTGPLPFYETREIDLPAAYEERIAAIHRTGFGIYARHNMFRVEAGKIVPVKSPDLIRTESLLGYELQREKLIDNTRALVRGLPAANALLTGDAGTGKSSTVKAVANLFAPEGVRLIELRKEQLRELPALMEELRENPLKFILFVDDLSFNRNDDNFSALKASLEGSASARAKNVAIYATSNRRHLVKETFEDREGGDVHRNDTMQELLSLSERFGLNILFTRPSKALYLHIVHGLAERKGIGITAALDVEAAAFALRKGGMSPRAAEQFTDSILAGRKEAT